MGTSIDFWGTPVKIFRKAKKEISKLTENL